AELVLGQMKRGQKCGPPPFGRIRGDGALEPLVEALLLLRRKRRLHRRALAREGNHCGAQRYDTRFGMSRQGEGERKREGADRRLYARRLGGRAAALLSGLIR